MRFISGDLIKTIKYKDIDIFATRKFRFENKKLIHVGITKLEENLIGFIISFLFDYDDEFYYKCYIDGNIVILTENNLIKL